MAEEIVHVEWGPFLGSCYVSLKDGEKFGPTLHVSGEGQVSTAKILKDLLDLGNSIDVPLESIRRLLPSKGELTWEGQLKGDRLLGYEIRGTGPGYRVWMTSPGDGTTPELTAAQRAARYQELPSAIDVFFP